MFRENYTKYDARGLLKSADGKIEVPICFECSQLFDGNIIGRLEIEEKEHGKYLELLSDFGPYEIEGKTDDGKTVVIDKAYITGHTVHHREEFTLSNIRFEASQLEAESRSLTSKDQSVMLRFGVMNFKLFRAIVQTKIGKLTFLKPPHHDQIVKDIQTHRKACLTSIAQLDLKQDVKCETAQKCLNAARDEIEKVLNLTSLAQGIYQDWMFCEVSEKVDDKHEIIYVKHRSPKTKQMGFNEVVHFLDMANYLSKTYPSYDDNLDQEKGFKFALEWYLESLGADVVESKFILGFICLELLVNRFEKAKGLEFILDERDFGSFLEALKTEARKILGSMGVESEKRAEIYSGLRAANRYSFQNNLKRLLEENRIGYKDIFSDLSEITRIRDEIAHQGLANVPFETVFENFRKLMCLNQRIMFAFLNYDGGSMMDWLQEYKGKAFSRDPQGEYSKN